ERIRLTVQQRSLCGISWNLLGVVEALAAGGINRAVDAFEPFDACSNSSSQPSQADLSVALTRHAAAHIESERSLSFTALRQPDCRNWGIKADAPCQRAGPVRPSRRDPGRGSALFCALRLSWRLNAGHLRRGRDEPRQPLSLFPLQGGFDRRH